MRAVVAGVVVVASALLAAAVVGLPRGVTTALADRTGLPEQTVAQEPSQACETTVDVPVVAGGELAPALDVLRSAQLGPTDTGVCARVRPIDLGPVETLAALTTTIDSPRRPGVWIPDSSLWRVRAEETGVSLEDRGSLGTSPVVVASSAAVMDSLGWASDPPTWAEVFGTDRALAVPDLQASAGALMAIGAAGAGPEQAAVTVQAALSRQRAGSLSPSQGLAQAAMDGADAPLVITSEQDVVRRTGGSDGLVVAIAPADGTPVLDYPVLAVPAVGARSDDEQVAVDLVLTALATGPGAALAMEAGLRGADLEPLPGWAPIVSVSEPFLRPDPAAADALVADLTRLAPPSQLLVVVDVSLSMSAEVGDGFTRADIATDALDRALVDLPGPTRVSMWQFASLLDGDTDYVEVLPSARLDSTAGGTEHRQLLDEAVAAIPTSLVSGGTSLYDTVDAATTAARDQWRPDTVSTVVFITDGRNEDSSGLDLAGLTARLQEQADPSRPVGFVAVAFGPDADVASLEQVAAAAQAGGPSQAVNARNPAALQSLLVQLLAARTAQPPPP